jgi:hypothetical protein
MRRYRTTSRVATLAQGLMILWLSVGPWLGAVASSLAVSPGVVPISGTEHDEEERSQEVRSSVAWLVSCRADRRTETIRSAAVYAMAPLPRDRLRGMSRERLCPSMIDPFANGLGSPYRC